MPIGVSFQKSRAGYFVDCLANGNPIDVVATVDDMLAFAGACFFAVMSHGPALKQGVEWSKVPSEHREAEELHFFEEILAAIEYCGQLSMHIHDGEYDDMYEPHVRAIVCTNGEKKKLIPVQGFRNV